MTPRARYSPTIETEQEIASLQDFVCWTVEEDAFLAGECPYYFLDEVSQLLGYASIESAYVAVNRGTFPVSTYRLAGWRVVDRQVVREFFQAKRKLGLEKLRRRLRKSRQLERQIAKSW